VNRGKAILKGLKYTVVFFIVYAILCIILYFLLGVADVPIDYHLADLGAFDHVPDPAQPQNITETTQAFQVSFLLFFISIMSILGGVLFVVFGGFGLVLLPMDLIQSYRARPIPISEKDYKARKILLGERADELIREGAGYKNSRPSRRIMNEWRQEVFLLEEEFDLTQAAYKRKFPIFFYWGMLALGIIGFVGPPLAFQQLRNPPERA
jgi:LMBR1 domain-containing protein 1